MSARFTVAAPDLHAAAGWAVRATAARHSDPILAGLILAATDDHLMISGYDLETRASATVAATTHTAVRVLVAGRLLVEVAKTLARSAEVVFTVEGSRIRLESGSAEWLFPLLPIQDYPQLPDPGPVVGTVDAEALRYALTQVLPVLEYNAANPMLGAVKIESDARHLTLVGTDRFRVATATIPWEPANEQSCLDEVIPGQLLDAVVRGCTSDDGPLGITCSTAGFGVQNDARIVVGRHMGVDFLRWRTIIPNPAAHCARVEVAALTKAIEQALIGAEVATVRLEFERSVVHVTSSSTTGHARASIAAQLAGDPFTVAVKADFLRAATQLHGCDAVTVHFGANPNKPLLVLGEAPETYQHTLMPIRDVAAPATAA